MNISKINLKGTNYDIKDKLVRDSIGIPDGENNSLGIAPLDASGKVPSENLPTIPQLPDLFNGHDEYVDLGLPSGTLWATMNVGATSETDYGNYYMYGVGSKTYNKTDTPYASNEDPLDLSKDTARVVWGGLWHMPTKAQIQELIDNTTYQWVTNYKGSGINGGTFTATNGAVLFFPAAGYWSGSSQNDVGSIGHYWGSSPYASIDAFSLDFYDGEHDIYANSRNMGESIRPVITLSDTLHKVSVTGDYNDLNNKPSSPVLIGDDAARANWGGDWRMPTNAELQTLGAAVNTSWTDDYQSSGVVGLVCTDKTDSSKTLFFPAAGYCSNGRVKYVGKYSQYWSSSLYTDEMQYACYFESDGVSAEWDYTQDRDYGCPVRPILDGTNANGHDYVEIGGIKWATMNVGANSVADYGLYFQWGDAQGYTASQVGSGEGKKYFGWADYKYGNGGGSDSDMTKYNSADGLTTLEYLHNVAVTGDYNDLSNKPTIPSIAPLAKQTYLTYITIYPEDCYFTYIALGDGTCRLANSDYYYSKDLGVTWNHITSSSTLISVVKGDVVLFKGTITPQAYAGVGRFYSSAAYEVAGNPMSFIYGDDFRGQTAFPSNMPESSGFLNMFYNETNLRSAKHLILTASSVPYMAYATMFDSCSNLVAGPIIAAETVLGGGCDRMFQYCTKLSYINTRFIYLNGWSPLSNWVSGITDKGIFIKNVNATWTKAGVEGVPDGWTVYYDYQH